MDSLSTIIKDTIDYNIQSLLNYKFYDITGKLTPIGKSVKYFSFHDGEIISNYDDYEDEDEDEDEEDIYNLMFSNKQDINKNDKNIENNKIIYYPNFIDDVEINDFQYFTKSKFNESKICERNSCFSKIYFNLNNLPDNFDIIKFINDFNQYLKNVEYSKEINFKKYNKRITYFDQIMEFYDEDSTEYWNNQEIRYNIRNGVYDLEWPELTPIYLIAKNNTNGKNIHIILNYYSYFIDDILYMVSEFSILNPQYKPYIDLTSYLYNHYLRCIYQQGNLKNQNNYYEIDNVYNPDFPNLDLMNIINNQTKILLSFINISENNLPKEIKRNIHFNYPTNDYENNESSSICLSELLMKLIEYHNLER